MRIADWIEIGRMDDLGRLDTPVHRLDARSKIIVTMGFIVVVMSFARYEISGLMPFFLYPFVMLSVGRIPLRRIGVKILIAAPFALLVGIFNPLFDRQPVMAIGTLAVTGGWLSFVSIMLRFILTVGAALVLVACTGMHRLGAGMERLGIPDVFVVQLLFLYRYLFVVADQGLKMIRGVELRSPAGAPALSMRAYGSLIGHLLIRSMDRAERVYRAMMARGFDGEIRQFRRESFRWNDWLFVCGWLTFFVVARRCNLAEAVGRLMLGVIG